MILLQERLPSSDGCGPIVVFGAGLLGSGIVRALTEADPSLEIAELPLSWDDEAARRQQLSDLQRGIKTRVGSSASRPTVSLIWSAGRAGFAASEEEAAAELSGFTSVLATAVSLAEELPDAEVALLVVSSAGGLFEGQRLVDERSSIAPRRPYGELKARQERALSAAPSPLKKRIYRVSSVYGFVDPRHRMGLIPTLLRDGLRRRVSTIVGSPSTLRDFVWVDDIGRHIAREVLGCSFESQPTVVYLCSGRATSLGEVQHHVERALGRRLYVVFAADRTNAADITFSPRLLPADWQPTDLRLSILELHRAAMARGFEPPRERAGLRERLGL